MTAQVVRRPADDRWSGRRRTGSSPDRRRWWLGTFGAACIILGSGWYQVWVGPPYNYVDEQAHAGYVLEIQAGRLPTIDSPIDAEAGGPELRERLALEAPRRRDVWVANNPPLPYLVGAVPAALTRALGLPGGPLIGMRLVNLFAMTGAVVLTCRIGRAMAGGDRRVGILAGAIVAAVPHTGFLAGLGMTDGVALLATLATLDAAVTLGDRPSRRQWGWLVLATALGASVRPMTAVLCGVILCGAVIRWLLDGRPSGDGTESSAAGREQGEGGIAAGGARTGSALFAAASVVAATALAWYVRNAVIYGDPTASGALFDKFARVSRPFSDFFALHRLRLILDTLFLRRLQKELETDPLVFSPVVSGIVAAAVVGALVLGWRGRRGSTSRRTAGTPVAPGQGRGACVSVDLRIVVLVLAVVVTTLLLMALHWSGGGGLHPRYALLLVPVLAALAAAVAVRLGGGWAGVLLLLGPVALLWHQVPRSTTWVNDHKTAPVGSALTMSIGPDWWRLSGMVLVAVGVLAVGWALVRGGGSEAGRRLQHEAPIPPPGLVDDPSMPLGAPGDLGARVASRAKEPRGQ